MSYIPALVVFGALLAISVAGFTSSVRMSNQLAKSHPSKPKPSS